MQSGAPWARLRPRRDSYYSYSYYGYSYHGCTYYGYSYYGCAYYICIDASRGRHRESSHSRSR
jgi:hypothetical protein